LKAVITGILGQDGSLLAELLNKFGYEVIGFVKEGRLNSVTNLPEKSYITKTLETCTICELDITNLSQVVELFNKFKPDEVYHLAACHHSSERGLGFDVELHEEMFRSNCNSTQTIVNAILKFDPNCRFLFAGSSQMFTPLHNEHLIDELSTMNPSTYYGITKMVCREIVEYYRKFNGFWGCTAILFNHESVRRSEEFVTRKVTSAVAKIKTGLQEYIELRDLSTRADWSRAEDIVEGLYLMLKNDEPEDFVLASGELRKISDLLEIAFERVGLDWRDHTNVSPHLYSATGSLVGNPNKARDKLQWKVGKGFKEMVEDMVDYDCFILEK